MYGTVVVCVGWFGYRLTGVVIVYAAKHEAGQQSCSVNELASDVYSLPPRSIWPFNVSASFEIVQYVIKGYINVFLKEVS